MGTANQKHYPISAILLLGLLTIANIDAAVSQENESSVGPTSVSLEVPSEQELRRRAERAVSAYETGLVATDRTEQVRAFETAQIEFRQILESYYRAGKNASPELWLAFGNASLKSEQLGWAVLAYRKAIENTPSGSRTALQSTNNLDFLRQSLGTASEIAEDASYLSQIWPTQPIIEQISGVLFFVACSLFGLSLAIRRSWPTWCAILPLTALAIMILMWVIGPQSDHSKIAVVVGDGAFLSTADLLDAPLQQADQLSIGTELPVLRRRNNFVEVDYATSTGWLPKHAIRTLDAPFDT
ncbi:MAG TPA: hypothetical protein DDW52_13225 [Planctomycetaceae bacterium]|nr:hypothetical protein [Planctomycetaceae bacterium]